MKLGRLKWPFVAGAAAIMMISALFSEDLFPHRASYVDRLAGGLFFGGLGVAILYAVMRVIMERK
jgi:hypothetical protein